LTRAIFVRRARAALALAVVLAAAGCIFQPRTAEDPTGTQQVVWVVPHFLGNQLGNMKRALQSKPAVLTNYERAFRTGPLVMELDPFDQADLGDTEFQDWTAAKEGQRMSGILNQAGATLTVSWTVGDSLQGDGPSILYYKDLAYRLTFTKAGLPVVYSGKVNLYFEDNGTGSWFITRWQDQRDGSANHTWGWLRARNRVEFPGLL
jgi:hypothetical protein